MSNPETYYTVYFSETSEYRQVIRATSRKEALSKFKKELHDDKYTPEEVYVEDCSVCDTEKPEIIV